MSNWKLQVESGVKASSALLVPVQAKADALARDMRTMRDVLNHLAARDLSEPTIASVRAFYLFFF